MFVKAIENVSRFVRPICFVERLNNDELVSGTSTIFFVNFQILATQIIIFTAKPLNLQ